MSTSCQNCIILFHLLAETLFGSDQDGAPEAAHVRGFGDRVREVRLRWSEHIQRRDREYIRRILLELPGKSSTVNDVHGCLWIH